MGKVILINRSRTWVRPEPGDPKKNILLVVIMLLMFSVVSGIHNRPGVNPFRGV